MANLSISWPSFECIHEDPHKAFEDMCGSLFKSMFAPEGTIMKYKPQNPGVECEPIIDKDRGERISFQAKYFGSIRKYDQIKKSAREIVKHYSGKLDKVYLYCNKNLKTDGKQYRDIEILLSTARIALVPITDQEILHEVQNNLQIAKSYFYQSNISHEWFQETLQNSLADLGYRYNSKFNIVTETERKLDLFFQNSEAANAINSKKVDALKAIENNRLMCSKHCASIQHAIDFIEELPDVDRTQIQDSYNWADQVAKILAKEISEAQIELYELENKKTEDISKEDRELIRSLRWLIHIPDYLRISDYERKLIEKKTLLISGKTGSGKSQALANMAAKTNDEGNEILLVLGNKFLSNEPLSIQLTHQVSLNIELDDLLDICNEYGNKDNCFFVICIDAINESANKSVWQTGLAGFITAVEKRSHLKLLVSYRDGFEHIVLGDAVIERIKEQSIISLHHSGFQNESPDVVQDYLNYFSVPFSPDYYIQQEMTNPLFLRLFCKAYDGSSIDISTIIDRIIEQTDSELSKVIGITGSGAQLKEFLRELSKKRLNNDLNSFPKEVLYKLEFWDTYGLSHLKIQYISSLVNLGILYDFAYEDNEYYYFSFNLVEEYLCAKTIMQLGKTKEEIRKRAQKIIVDKDGHGVINSNIGVFIALCSLYAEEFGEECISIVDGIGDQFDRREIERQYIESFSWRKSKAINGGVFREYANDKNLEPSTVFALLLECATKSDHPLDAFFLHKILIDKSLAERDLVWTCCINDLPEVCQRFYSIILYLEKGGRLRGLNDKSVLRLAIALTWLLSSSNRIVRDRTSKALIELCKENLEIPLQLLNLFSEVNDPYIVQRLYGVVFGTCTKRIEEHSQTYRQIVDYVYKHVFCQKTVYPDILMRDYARLIIERFIHEYPENASDYDLSIIRPPYSSHPIPDLAPKDYNKCDRPSGFNRIMNSMRPDTRECGFGMYGDFGRYVFQAAVSRFRNVDVSNLYYYALDYILNDLGYSDDLFTHYDACSRFSYLDRTELKKTERIGKKYQWITLFSILAKLSDTNPLKNWNDEDTKYEGPIEPLVKDFDPTFNAYFTHYPHIPSFNETEKPLIGFIRTDSSEDEARKWVGNAEDLFDNQTKRLLLVDGDGVQWLALHRIDSFHSMKDMWDHNSMKIKNGAQEALLFSNAFIVRRKDLSRLKKYLNNVRLKEINFPGKTSSQLYNREIFWSYATESVFEDEWIELKVPSGKTRTVSIAFDFDDDFLNELIGSYGGNNHEYQEMIMKSVCKIMPSYCSYTWESEYDSSACDVSSYELPCKGIAEGLNLSQKEYDGYFFSKEGILVAYDSKLGGQDYGLLIRKDYLDKYLLSNKLVLCWECTGEKRFIRQDEPLIASDWEGLFVLNNNTIEGEMELIPTDENVK